MIRATTIGVLKNYRYGLNNSFTKQNDARTTVFTHRNFNSFAEDPAAAARSFQLRRARMTAESQYNVCDTSYRRFQSAWDTLDTIINDVDNANARFDSTIKQAGLEGLNDPTGDARTALAKVINETADTLVQVMNNTYAGTFLFSGADGQTVPFTWGDNGELLYRGIPVDSAVPETLTYTDGNGAEQKFTLKLDADGNYNANGSSYYILAGKSELVEYDPNGAVPEGALKNAAGDAVILKEDGTAYADMTEVNDAIAAGEKCYFAIVSESGAISQEDYDTEVKNAEKLRYLSEDEKLYMDIGLGNKEDENNKVISSSVFDSTLQGINFLGYGKDADGDPKNIVSIVKQMGDILNKVKDGKLSQSDYDDLFRLTGKMEDASARLQDAHTNMDARSSTLKNNLGLLEDNMDDLVEQYAGIEDVNDADAISAFLWASYSYNAALRVGNSVLSQSLMDYMQ